jgi:hypothetical protein
MGVGLLEREVVGMAHTCAVDHIVWQWCMSYNL